MTEDSSGADHCYVAYDGKCGCPRSLIVDELGKEGTTGAIVAQYIRDGKKVERMTVALARILPWRCPHREEKPQQGALAL